MIKLLGYILLAVILVKAAHRMGNRFYRETVLQIQVNRRALGWRQPPSLVTFLRVAVSAGIQSAVLTFLLSILVVPLCAALGRMFR